jgi:hypothetical protein
LFPGISRGCTWRSVRRQFRSSRFCRIRFNRAIRSAWHLRHLALRRCASLCNISASAQADSACAERNAPSLASAALPPRFTQATAPHARSLPYSTCWRIAYAYIVSNVCLSDSCCAMAAFRRLEYERSCGMGRRRCCTGRPNGEAAFGAHEPTRGLARRANPCERIPTDRAHRRASHEREGPENTFPPITMRSEPPMRSASRARSARTIAIRDVNPPKPHPHP